MSAVEQIIVTMFRREMLDFFIEPMRHFPRNDVIMPSLMNGERQTGQRFRIVDRRAFSVSFREFVRGAAETVFEFCRIAVSSAEEGMPFRQVADRTPDRDPPPPVRTSHGGQQSRMSASGSAKKKYATGCDPLCFQHMIQSVENILLCELRAAGFPSVRIAPQVRSSELRQKQGPAVFLTEWQVIAYLVEPVIALCMQPDNQRNALFRFRHEQQTGLRRIVQR